MAWTTENYFTKAHVYWSKATSRGRANEDFLLNVSFTLEFVIRGAVCKVNPALNAATDLESLLFASGQDPRTPAKTADLLDVIKRLQRLVPILTDAEIINVRALIDARNGELHGDLAVMPQLTADSLMPSIYSFIVKAAEFAGENLSTLLGVADAQLAKQTADAMTKDRTKRVADLIRVCKDRFFSLPKAEQKEKRDASEPQFVSAVLTSGHHVLHQKCPACAQRGRIMATPVGRSAAFLRDDELVQEVRVIPMQFVCKCCGLEIGGLDELMAAGFSHEYCSIDGLDPVDHFNIDVHDYSDPEAIAREYHDEMNGYNDE